MSAVISLENLNFSGVRLLTGTPGAGKSLRMIYLMEQANKQGLNVFVCNLETCKFPFAQWLDDAKDWATLPPKSVLFVDEAQKFFRQRRGNVAAPEYLTDMETLRHRGISIVMTTQQPSYLDSHLRGLIGLHEHLMKGLGNADYATIHQLRECHTDIQSQSVLDGSDRFDWKYPVHLYPMYQSAEVHTVRKFMPRKRLLAYVLFGLMFAAIAAVGFRMVSRGSVSPLVASDSETSEQTQQVEAKPTPTNAQEYLKQQLALVPAQPWSSPLYAQRQAQAQPMIYCMSTNDIENPSCSCITEQGTKYALPISHCKIIARDGLYNPYKQPMVNANAVQTQQQQPQNYMPRTVAGASGSPSDVGNPNQGKVW